MSTTAEKHQTDGSEDRWKKKMKRREKERENNINRLLWNLLNFVNKETQDINNTKNKNMKNKS